MELKKIFQITIYAMIGSVILADVFGWSQDILDTVFNWILAILVSAVLSAISGKLIESFTGDTFKKASLNFPIWKLNFSITVFAILTLVLKFLLFK